MKLEHYHGNPILSKNPNNHWEAGSVLNPSIIFDNGISRMVCRATNNTEIDIPVLYMFSIGYVESVDGIRFARSSKPLIFPDQDYEKRL